MDWNPRAWIIERLFRSAIQFRNLVRRQFRIEIASGYIIPEIPRQFDALTQRQSFGGLKNFG